MSQHLSEATLIQWLDEPGEVAEAGVREHLAACAPCREQADALRRVFAELAAAAALQDPADLEAALAGQRDRIAGLVTTVRPRPRWIQLAAAASLAALVMLTTDRPVRDQTSVAPPESPIVAAAEEAAEEALAVGAVPAELEFAALDDQLLLEDAFAALPPYVQADILDELAGVTLTNP
ncbi:MAG: hypothetical protein ABR559_09305 [Gemmatimonadota bacterium]